MRYDWGHTTKKKKLETLNKAHQAKTSSTTYIREQSNQIKTRTWDLSTEWTKRGQVQDWCQNEKFLFRMLGCIVLSKKR